MTSGKSTPRFAVVGTGAISQVVHVPILTERSDAHLSAVVDLDPHKATAIADRLPQTVAMEVDEVFDDDALDAVVIATPNHLHEEQAVAALEAGKHVFVERPLALTAEGAERVLKAARASGKILVVGLPHRYRPEFTALQSFVAGGELGEIYAVRGSWLTRGRPLYRATWRQDESQAGGGALMDLGVPAVDLCMWLVGYPSISRVTCTVKRLEYEVEDAATLTAETSDGLVFSVEVSNRYFAKEDRYYARVMGTDGSASVPPFEVFRQVGGRPMDVTPRQPKPRGGENPYTNAYRRQLDYFVRAVCGQVDAPLPEEQVSLLSLIEAAYRSAEEGREITL